MKRLPVTVILLVILSSLVPGIGFAQQEAPAPEVADVEVVSFLRWLTSDPINWTEGITFFVLGLVGALTIMYFLIGGKLPGIASQAQIDYDRQLYDRTRERLDHLLYLSPPDWPGVHEVQTTANELRDDIDRRSNRLFALAAPLYVLLGAFFATALAQDMLQALAVGAGWTSFAGVLGLKADYAERKSIKDGALERAASATKNAKRSLKGMNKEKLRALGPDYAEPMDRMVEEIDDLEKEISVAKGL